MNRRTFIKAIIAVSVAPTTISVHAEDEDTTEEDDDEDP